MKTKKEMPITLGLMKRERDSTALEHERISGRWNRAHGEATEAEAQLKELDAALTDLNAWIEEHEPKQLTKNEVLFERMDVVFHRSLGKFMGPWAKVAILKVLNEEDAK